MFDHRVSLKTAGLGIALAHSLLWSGNAPAEPIAGCPSETILSQFEDFGRSGKMPLELGRWLSDPKARRATADAALNTVEGLAGARSRTLTALEPYLLTLRLQYR